MISKINLIYLYTYYIVYFKFVTSYTIIRIVKLLNKIHSKIKKTLIRIGTHQLIKIIFANSYILLMVIGIRRKNYVGCESEWIHKSRTGPFPQIGLEDRVYKVAAHYANYLHYKFRIWRVVLGIIITNHFINCEYF